MLSVQIDEDNLIVILEPEGPLSESDFQSAVKKVDPLIKKSGRLNGIIISTKSFPGWESFAALCSHLRFVKDHHKKITRVALVTDSLGGNLAELVASHFVKAEVKSFPYEGYEQANKWIIGDNQK